MGPGRRGVAIMASAKGEAKAPPALEDAVGIVGLPREDVEDELQAQGRVAPGQDPPDASRPGAEVITTVAARVVGVPTSEGRIPAREGARAEVVGPVPVNATPDANT